MEEMLKMLRKDRFLELSSWAGLSGMPGTSGLIITNNRMIYHYHSYHNVPSYLKGKVKLEDISSGKRISDDVYLKLVRYIKRKIIGKIFKDLFIFDCGCSVIGDGFDISNNYKIYNKLSNIIGGDL
ncbi:MAG: hypothetical protein IKF91_03325 [Bacilli bacterium]|nr:hypothetical protein [Bacilli bacterium]